MDATLDLSALDILHGRKPAQETQMTAKSTKAKAADEVQAAKRKIVQGVKSGSDPYALLLQSIHMIATITCDRAFYTACKDKMQDAGMLEKECVQESLEDTGQNEHCWQQDTQDKLPTHIRQSFSKAYSFMGKHYNARTDDDFECLAADLTQYDDPFEIALVMACIDVIDRKCRQNGL